MSTSGTQQYQGKQRVAKSCISTSMVQSTTTKEGNATVVKSYLGALEDRQSLRRSLVPRRGWLGGPLIHMVELYQDSHPRVEPEQGLLQKVTGGKARQHARRLCGFLLLHNGITVQNGWAFAPGASSEILPRFDARILHHHSLPQRPNRGNAPTVCDGFHSHR